MEEAGRIYRLFFVSDIRTSDFKDAIKNSLLAPQGNLDRAKALVSILHWPEVAAP